MIFRVAAAAAWLAVLLGLAMILVLAGMRDASLTHLATLLIGAGLVARVWIARAEAHK